MFLRSPSGTSSSMVRSSFSTFRLSPVSALSLIFKLAFSMIRPSAHTESPASRKTISPTVTSRDEITTLFPSRRTFAVGVEICFKLARECSALICCTVPRMAFIIITARMTAALSISFRTMDTAAAAIRISTRKSLNCSKKITKTDFFCPSINSLYPYS